ncbi:MAG: VOC family protein [Gammaproteobacteria bacterium]|nr:VOC family protein [Gammaproteobacteria bacterium]
MSIRFQRANFLVSNMTEALRFYVDVLGMEVAFKKEGREAGYSHIVFGIEAGVKVDFVALSTPTQLRVMALTEVPGLVPQPEPRRSAIVLDVEDVDAVVARAKDGGFQVFEEEKLVTHDGRVGREIGILDGDGNLAVVYHITGRV